MTILRPWDRFRIARWRGCGRGAGLGIVRSALWRGRRLRAGRSRLRRDLLPRRSALLHVRIVRLRVSAVIPIGASRLRRRSFCCRLLDINRRPRGCRYCRRRVVRVRARIVRGWIVRGRIVISRIVVRVERSAYKDAYSHSPAMVIAAATVIAACIGDARCSDRTQCGNRNQRSFQVCHSDLGGLTRDSSIVAESDARNRRKFVTNRKLPFQ
jgi:hypothetical protein